VPVNVPPAALEVVAVHDVVLADVHATFPHVETLIVMHILVFWVIPILVLGTSEFVV
jgi:hypothetical protein